MLHTYIFINYCPLKGQGLLTGADTWSSTPDPSCSSETQGEVRNLPRAVGILSSRGSTPACAALSLEATSIAGQQQGTSGTGHFFFPSMPHSEPERGSARLDKGAFLLGMDKTAPKGSWAFSLWGSCWALCWCLNSILVAPQACAGSRFGYHPQEEKGRWKFHSALAFHNNNWDITDRHCCLSSLAWDFHFP